jgi:hypothetical protein
MYHLTSFAVAFDDNVRANAFFDIGFTLLQQLGTEQDHAGGSVAHFGILGPCNVDQGLGGGMDHL